MIDEVERKRDELAAQEYDYYNLGDRPAEKEAFKAGFNQGLSMYEHYYIYSYRENRTKSEEIKCELLRKIKIAKEAFMKIINQDRLKGYPTGNEWIDILKDVKESLEKINDTKEARR